MARNGGVFLVVALAAGCVPGEGTSSSASSGGPGCVPGTQQACACLGTGQGVQVCLASGKEFGPCQCPGTSSSAGTSTSLSTAASSGPGSSSGVQASSAEPPSSSAGPSSGGPGSSSQEATSFPGSSGPPASSSAEGPASSSAPPSSSSAGCPNPAACDDHDACTDDACTDQGTCTHTRTASCGPPYPPVTIPAEEILSVVTQAKQDAEARGITFRSPAEVSADTSPQDRANAVLVTAISAWRLAQRYPQAGVGLEAYHGASGTLLPPELDNGERYSIDIILLNPLGPSAGVLVSGVVPAAQISDSMDPAVWTAWADNWRAPVDPGPWLAGSSTACGPGRTSPDWEDVNGVCLPSCGVLGGACAASAAECAYGERGRSHDCTACCRTSAPPDTPWDTVTESQLRAWRGSIATTLGPLPCGPRPGQADNMIFTAQYDSPCWSEQDRALARQKQREHGYTHWAMGPIVSRGYHDQYPNTDWRSNPDGFLDRVEELWLDGFIPAIFLIPDTGVCSDGASIDHGCVEAELEPIYRSARFQSLARVVVLAWEPDYGAADWQWGVQWMASVFPNALRYIHFPSGHGAPGRGSELVPNGPYEDERAMWLPVAPAIHGFLLQETWTFGGATDQGRTPLEQFQYDVWDFVRRFRDGYANWPTQGAGGHRVDVVAFEYASYYVATGSLGSPESVAQTALEWGAAALGIDGVAGFGDGGP